MKIYKVTSYAGVEECELIQEYGNQILIRNLGEDKYVLIDSCDLDFLTYFSSNEKVKVRARNIISQNKHIMEKLEDFIK